MKIVLLLYLPVLHRGYINLFRKLDKKLDTIYIFGEDLINEFTVFHKEIRALNPKTAKKLLLGLNPSFNIKILDKKSLDHLKENKIYTINDELSKKIVKKYLSRHKVSYIPVFLRWDERLVKSAKPARFSKSTSNLFHRKIMKKVLNEGDKSSDWWRQVGAIIVKNKKIILKCHNKHFPSEHLPYIEGDPRDYVKAGKHPELSTAIHAEQSAISEAARRGISLKGTSIYVSVFPCPVCAKLIANSGIKNCYFASGNAYLDVERTFELGGVKTIYVEQN